MKSYQHFFLIHQYAGNKGDRAVLFSLCRILRQINPTCKICVSTSSPELWSNDNYFLQNNIIFVPSGWDYQREPKHNIWRKFIKKFKKYTFTIMRESTLLGFESLIGRFFINSSFWQALQSSDIVISVGGHHFTTLLSKDLVSSINFDALSVTLAKKVFICFSQSFAIRLIWQIL